MCYTRMDEKYKTLYFHISDVKDESCINKFNLNKSISFKSYELFCRFWISISLHLKGLGLFRRAWLQRREIQENIKQISNFSLANFKELGVETSELRTFDCLKTFNILKFLKKLLNFSSNNDWLVSWSLQRKWNSLI